MKFLPSSFETIFFEKKQNQIELEMFSKIIDFSQYRDIRYHYFHIYNPNEPHNFSTDLTQFPGLQNSFFIEDFLRVHADFIHKNLEKWYYSFYISIVYLISIVLLKNFMKNRPALEMRSVLIAWNIALAIFSILGTIRCLPEFVHVLYHHGLRHSYSKSTYYYDYRVNSWYLLFTLSKAVELLDTAFVLLRKKPLIALHWVHHVLTLNYSWFVFSDAPATARWMGTMNFVVHSLMYTYYAIKVAGFYVPKRISLTITTLQITQMFIGLYVNYKALQLKLLGLPCDASLSVVLTGVTLYGLFAILFINFFIWTYVIKRSRDKIQSAVKRFRQEKTLTTLDDNANNNHINDSNDTKRTLKFVAKKVQ